MLSQYMPSTIRKAAAEYGVPVEVLEYCANADDVEGMARAYKDTAPRIHAAATNTRPPVFQGLPDEPPKQPREIFGEWANNQMMQSHRVRIL